MPNESSPECPDCGALQHTLREAERVRSLVRRRFDAQHTVAGAEQLAAEYLEANAEYSRALAALGEHRKRHVQ